MKKAIITSICIVVALGVGMCGFVLWTADPKPRKDLPDLDLSQIQASFSLDVTEDNSIAEATRGIYKTWDFERAYEAYRVAYSNMSREQAKEYMEHSDAYSSFDVPCILVNQSNISIAGGEVRVSHTKDNIYFFNSLTEGMEPTSPGETLDRKFSFLVKTTAVSEAEFLEYLKGLTIYYKVYYAMTEEDIVDGRTKEIEIPYTCKVE